MAPPRFAGKALTDEQLRLLLRTTIAQWPVVFRGYPRTFLTEERKRAREKFPPEYTVEADVAQAVERSRAKDFERRLQAALLDNDRLRRELATLSSLPAPEPADMRITAKAPREHEATALVLASDWHCEERVESASVNGLNEYNLDVFASRSRWFFANALKLIRKEAKAIPIRRGVLWIGGDMFSGDIHQDVAESCQLGPMDACGLAQDTVLGGIRKLLADTPDDFQWWVVFSMGNHSRTTPEQLVANEAAHSLEWYMSGNLARALAGEPRVHVIRERGYLTYLDVYGRTLRFQHGHAIRYQGGVGGVTIPLLKAIARFNMQRRAYLDLVAHYHQRIAGEGFLMNNALIGLNAYALRMGARPEPATQTLALIDSRHGLTVTAPILLEAA